MSIYDLLAEEVLDALKGMITPWSGAIVDIPTGWQLCDGTNGTPDLQNQFVVGCPGPYCPSPPCGNQQHDHDFTSDYHAHGLLIGTLIPDIYPFGQIYEATNAVPLTGTTDPKNNLPPYYALCYIMRI